MVGDDASAAAAGTWALSGYQPGKGAIFGQVTIAPQGGADSGEFTTEITYTVPRAPAST